MQLAVRPSLRTFLALEDRVGAARLALQRAGDCAPAIEKRIADVMRLVEERDRAMAPPGGCAI